MARNPDACRCNETEVKSCDDQVHGKTELTDRFKVFVPAGGGCQYGSHRHRFNPKKQHDR